MKKIVTKISFTTLAVLFFATSLQAKIWRLNNNNGGSNNPIVTADFTGTLQLAHNNVSVLNGDTIHVEQSTTSYGPCIFTKRLIIIGSGYFLDKNPQTQVNNASTAGSKVDLLTFYDAASASSVVTGVQMTGCYAGVNNLTVSRCFNSGQIIIGSNVANTTLTGIKILQNYFNFGGWAIYFAGTGGTITTEIYGNIVASLYGINLDARFGGIIKNNVFNTFYNPISVHNFTISNNIAVPQAGAFENTFTNCTVSNNVGTNNNLFVSPTGSGNSFSANLTRTVAQIAYLGGTSTDGQFQLSATSACLAQGEGGIDCGAFAGSYPYKLSGIPAVPNIYGLTIATIPAGASTISVTVNAKSNN